MRTIFKYQIPFGQLDLMEFDIPRGARILPHIEYEKISSVHETINFWAEVDTTEPPEKRTFRIFGTGHELITPLNYIDTVVLYDGRIVFHLYETVR